MGAAIVNLGARRVKMVAIQLRRAGRERRLKMRSETTGLSIARELMRFSKNSRQLRRLYKDTKCAIEEVIKGGYFSKEQVCHLQETEEQETTISRAVAGRATIVVLGRSCTAKAAVVNELFGSSVLPSGITHGPEEMWRTVRFTYGQQTEISLTVPDSAYDLMEDLAAYDQGWQTIPRADLTIDGCDDPTKRSAVLEVKMKNALLREEVTLVVSPSEDSVAQTLARATEGQPLPSIIIYAVQDESLSAKEEQELRELKSTLGSACNVLFVGPSTGLSTCMCDLTESEQHARRQNSAHALSELFRQLQALGFVLDRVHSEGPCSMLVDSVDAMRQSCSSQSQQGNGGRKGRAQANNNANNVVLFVRRVLQWLVVDGANALNELQSTVLNMFILSAFEFIRDRSITPMRIEYAREKEAELFKKLLEVANNKQEEIRLLIARTIEDLRGDILYRCAAFEFLTVSREELEEASTHTRQKCAAQIQDLVLSVLSSAVADKLIGSVTLLRESFVGTLERCLTTLEGANSQGGGHPNEDTTNSLQASHALRQILNAAYQLEVTVRTSSSILWVFLEKMRQFIQVLPGRGSPCIDTEWKQRVAYDLLESLSESRLAKCICAQFRDKLKNSHERFVVAMTKLKADHDGRIDMIKNEKDKIRNVLAPCIARYSLEAVSLRDSILYGMPWLGRELGRGQYGVVFSCDSWGMRGPAAVKSVVPPDDKHWNDLAMEFFYTRSLPSHERLVPLRGSVIDYNYALNTPAVLLVMDRLTQDLHTALHNELPFLTRMQIAQDVVQGIRFLHSQGLMHRDIKLKNVLLDNKNRAKITDLGFCKPNAMISGSIVGTPIHMAPELFSQKYDKRVDTYAFGVLFWYLCAGSTQLPATFADCPDKDSLWTNVRKGARPERLPVFSDACWELMSQCWHHEPDQRPHLGDVEERIIAIMTAYKNDVEKRRESMEAVWSVEQGVDAARSQHGNSRHHHHHYHHQSPYNNHAPVVDDVPLVKTSASRRKQRRPHSPTAIDTPEPANDQNAETKWTPLVR
ncbi:dual serine/threonine and tyrosine protein kinase-like [Tropilaelaps mercedesae]|uniref:Dual serine/threonine and tyrosine protein kinase n=1 Tax=Tropilaelaps mercedesae TaxID=418985 RepID=A0A1V9X3E2_9ACAR|nr:dual serine/threonine and tyrosine protein kinase-like [Tropilaelaps mercedesae]